ncbi:MAG: hypothetical protein Q4A50_05865 [Bacteroidales bacterium]|nr:hypothetical protein [Bacteroidales bacterium]
MKRFFFVCSLCSTITVVSVTSVITSCSSDEDYEFFEEQAYTLAPTTRSTISPEGNLDNPQFLKYSNCGLWSIAQMCGSADNSKYQGAVLYAAKSAINWDEDENMNNLQNNTTVRGLKGDEILSVCNAMKEINKNAHAFDKISGLDNNLPNTYEKDSLKARQIIENLKNTADGKRVRGAMVGLETKDADGNNVEHWVSLENFSENGDMQVRDPLTSQQYYYSEKNGMSQYSDRYKNNYSVSRVKCVLYKK